MVILTEVTLQADYVLSACDGGKIPHFRNCYLINLPAYPSSTIVNTSLRKYIDMLEKIQRRATKLIPGLRDLSYE